MSTSLLRQARSMQRSYATEIQHYRQEVSRVAAGPVLQLNLDKLNLFQNELRGLSSGCSGWIRTVDSLKRSLRDSEDSASYREAESLLGELTAQSQTMGELNTFFAGVTSATSQVEAQAVRRTTTLAEGALSRALGVVNGGLRFAGGAALAGAAGAGAAPADDAVQSSLVDDAAALYDSWLLPDGELDIDAVLAVLDQDADAIPEAAYYALAMAWMSLDEEGLSVFAAHMMDHTGGYEFKNWFERIIGTYSGVWEYKLWTGGEKAETIQRYVELIVNTQYLVSEELIDFDWAAYGQQEGLTSSETNKLLRDTETMVNAEMNLSLQKLELLRYFNSRSFSSRISADLPTFGVTVDEDRSYVVKATEFRMMAVGTSLAQNPYSDIESVIYMPAYSVGAARTIRDLSNAGLSSEYVDFLGFAGDRAYALGKSHFFNPQIKNRLINGISQRILGEGVKAAPYVNLAIDIAKLPIQLEETLANNAMVVSRIQTNDAAYLADVLSLHFGLSMETTGPVIKTTEYSYSLYSTPMTEKCLVVINDYIADYGVVLGGSDTRVNDVVLSVELIASDPDYVMEVIFSIDAENPSFIEKVRDISDSYIYE